MDPRRRLACVQAAVAAVDAALSPEPATVTKVDGTTVWCGMGCRLMHDLVRHLPPEPALAPALASIDWAARLAECRAALATVEVAAPAAAVRPGPTPPPPLPAKDAAGRWVSGAVARGLSLFPLAPGATDAHADLWRRIAALEGALVDAPDGQPGLLTLLLPAHTPHHAPIRGHLADVGHRLETVTRLVRSLLPVGDLIPLRDACARLRMHMRLALDVPGLGLDHAAADVTRLVAAVRTVFVSNDPGNGSADGATDLNPAERLVWAWRALGDGHPLPPPSPTVDAPPQATTAWHHLIARGWWECVTTPVGRPSAPTPPPLRDDRRRGDVAHLRALLHTWWSTVVPEPGPWDAVLAADEAALPPDDGPDPGDDVVEASSPPEPSDVARPPSPPTSTPADHDDVPMVPPEHLPISIIEEAVARDATTRTQSSHPTLQFIDG